MAENKTKYILIDWERREWVEYDNLTDLKRELNNTTHQADMHYDKTTIEEIECEAIKITPSKKAKTMSGVLNIKSDWEFK